MHARTISDAATDSRRLRPAATAITFVFASSQPPLRHAALPSGVALRKIRRFEPRLGLWFRLHGGGASEGSSASSRGSAFGSGFTRGRASFEGSSASSRGSAFGSGLRADDGGSRPQVLEQIDQPQDHDHRGQEDEDRDGQLSTRGDLAPSSRRRDDLNDEALRARDRLRTGREVVDERRRRPACDVRRSRGRAPRSGELEQRNAGCCFGPNLARGHVVAGGRSRLPARERPCSSRGRYSRSARSRRWAADQYRLVGTTDRSPTPSRASPCFATSLPDGERSKDRARS